MIFLRLAGGLGNQIFQVAAASLLSRHWSLPISIDSSALSLYKTPRKLSIDKIINLNKLCLSNNVFHDSTILKNRIPRIIGGKFFGNYLINDRNILDSLELGINPARVYLDGYFIESINQEFFDQSLNIMHSFLVNKNKICIQNNVCIIHIRGGDFLELSWNLENQRDYYTQAISEIKSLCSDVKFIVATDDKQYAEDFMSSINVQYEFTQGALIDDFLDIISSEFAIISNSTFSFWARAFSSNISPNTKTWGPRYWRPNVIREIKLYNEVNNHVT